MTYVKFNEKKQMYAGYARRDIVKWYAVNREKNAKCKKC